MVETTFTEVQLAQARNGTTAATTIYAPTSKRAIIRYITICNATGTAATFSFYHDNTGVVYGPTQKLWSTVTVAAGGTWSATVWIPVADGGSIGTQSSTGGSLTYTLYGAEIS